MNELIWLQPTQTCIPLFDWCNWIFSPYEDYFQQIRNCFVWWDITSRLSSSDFSINIWPWIINVWTLPLIDIVLNWDFLEIANSIVDLSWLYSDFIFNIFDWSNSFPVNMWKNIVIKAIDWLTFQVSWPDTIEIWLPTPDDQYFVPGWPQPAVPPTGETDYMPFNKRLVLTWDNCHKVAFWAPPQCCLQTLNFNTSNKIISLPGGWHLDNWYVCTCWGCEPAGCNCNSSNSTNIVIPPPQPLVSINTDNQVLSLTIDPGVEELLCLTRWHGWTLGAQIPDTDSCVDLININEHTFDLQNNELALLWSDGLINSLIDLSQVNEHTLWLTVDPIDPLHYHDPLFPRHSYLDIIWCDLDINDTVDLMGVADEMLNINWRNLCVTKMNQPLPNCIPCKQQCVDLSMYNMDCDDVMDCTCWARIDWVDMWVLVEWSDPCWFDPALAPGTIACWNWWKWPTRTAQSYLRGKKVIYWWKRWTSVAATVAWDVPGVSANWAITSNSLWPNDAYETFFSVPRSIGEVTAFIQSRFWWAISNPCGWSWSNSCCGSYYHAWDVNEWDTRNIINILTWYVSRQKYYAKISLQNPTGVPGSTGNQTFWSQHTAYSGDRNDQRNQRWFIPNFNFAEWRHGQNSSMVSTYCLPWTPPFQHHNEISPDSWLLWTLTIADIWFSKDFWTFYSQTPSTNNPQAAEDSRFCRYWAQTITIVKDWRYQVALQWVIEVDHNVHAFRYSCIKYNKATWKLDLVIDSKYWWWSSSGSWSLNDPLIPRTNQRHWWWTKLLKLYEWDILFPAVKISPQTIWPKQSNPEPTKDILYELDVLTYLGNPIPYGIHTGWSISFNPWSPGEWGSAPSLSRSPGSITYPNHPSTVVIPTDMLARPTANLPNLSPHFFSPHGWLDWAENYWWNLMYPGWYNSGAWDDYWYDDWVLTIYGPSSWFNSDWSVDVEWTSEWASLTVHRVSSFQWDETERVVTP